MIFPFKVKKIYKLPESDFSEYSNALIIDRIYNDLEREEFTKIDRVGNKIEIKGNWNKCYFNIISFPDLTAHCIDKGTLEIIELDKSRKIKYTFKMTSYVIYLFLCVFVVTLFIGFIVHSAQTGLIIFTISSLITIVFWILLLVIHPLTISSSIERIRFEAIRKRNKVFNNNKLF